jgi:RHS repeat-associated protein
MTGWPVPASTGRHQSNDLSFVYDADGQRIQKQYREGESCDCGPDPLSATIELRTITDRPIRILRSDADSLMEPAADKARSDKGLGEPASGKANGADAGGGATIAGPIGDCVCYDKTVTEYIRTYDGRLMRVMENGQFARDFIYAGDRRIGVYEAGGSYGDLHYFLTDHLGSTRALLDSTGSVRSSYNYYPYGTERSSIVTTDTKMRYTGKELDDEEIKQHYFGARYLDDATLRFTSIDPEEVEYPSWSPYVYSMGNPVRLKDLGGESVVDGIFGFAEAVLSNFTIPGESGIPGFYTRTDVRNYPSSGREDFLAGRIAGDAAVMIAGAAGTVFGAGATAGSVGLVPASGGASAIATPGTAALTAGAAAVTVRAGGNLGKDLALFRQGDKGKGQTHHVATDKSQKSGYTQTLKGIFEKGGLSLQDKANKIFLEGHRGPHNPKYHEHVIEKLTGATEGLSGDAYTSALNDALAALRKEIESNPGMLKGKGL